MDFLAEALANHDPLAEPYASMPVEDLRGRYSAALKKVGYNPEEQHKMFLHLLAKLPSPEASEEALTWALSARIHEVRWEPFGDWAERNGPGLIMFARAWLRGERGGSLGTTGSVAGLVAAAYGLAGEILDFAREDPPSREAVEGLQADLEKMANGGGTVPSLMRPDVSLSETP